MRRRSRSGTPIEVVVILSILAILIVFFVEPLIGVIGDGFTQAVGEMQREARK